MRQALIVVLAAFGLIDAAPVEPIDDLQWLFIEDTVALIQPPSAEVGAQARALMDAAALARAAGDNSAMRRNLAEARVVLKGGTWDADAAFIHSLRLGPKRMVIDPAAPFTVTVSQWFAAPPPEGELTLELGVRHKVSGETSWHSNAIPASTDLSQPFLMLTWGMPHLADGSYDMILRVSQSKRLVGETSLGVAVVSGLDRDLAEIVRRKAAVRAPSPQLAASIAWPGDLARTLDNRSRQPVAVDWRALLDRTLAQLSEAEAGRDPLAAVPGDRERHYTSNLTGRIEPYRLLVPTCWDGKAKLPLVVLLHGSNGDHHRPFANGKAAEQAERHCWAVVAPMGYSPNSGWGNHLPVVLANGTMPAPRPSTIAGIVLPRDGVTPEPAEADVLDVVAEVRRLFPIDPRRIYLAGNSMGGEGTWHLAQRHPRLWAAVAPGAGAIDPARFPYARLGRLPVLGVHGNGDAIISFAATTDMIARLNRSGGQGTMLAISGGGHGAFGDVLDQIFAFFAAHSRREDGRAEPLEQP